MPIKTVTKQIQHYLDAGFPILYVHTFEEMKVDQAIAAIAKSAGKRVIEWQAAGGMLEWSASLDAGSGAHMKSPALDSDLEQTLVLWNDQNEMQQTLLVIKDGHPYFGNPRIISLLKESAHKVLSGADASVLLISSVLLIPPELEKYITIFDMGYLDTGEIKSIIVSFAEAYGLKLNERFLEEMTRALKGLSEYEINNILALAYATDGTLSKANLQLIHEQKRQTIKKSGILEMIPLKEGFDDIGGLDNLKSWLNQKAAVFRDLDRAERFGVDIPKGVLIVGVPGCGKSLNAKAAAKLLDVPLLRLDMGRLLGKYVGESEANMRRATELAEAIAPCVLWIDELEKAFAGIGEGGGSGEVTTRLFGHFLTWMQEKQSAAFVVATANDILKLPPELLRKGRFDEIFYVGLPSEAERKKIFEIHIAKRRKADLSGIQMNELAQKTKGYSGADIEGVVKESVETVYASGKQSLTTQDLIEAVRNTRSLSDIMKEPLEKTYEEYKKRFKNASSAN